MEKINLFSIESDESKITSSKSHLLLNQKKTSTLLEGSNLNYQFKLNNYYLLILTGLVGFGETVYFYLINSDLEVVDELFIGGDIYDSPFLSNLKIVGEDKIEFSYFTDNDKWLLTIFDSKKAKLPNLNPFTTIHRPKWSQQFFSHFELKHLK